MYFSLGANKLEQWRGGGGDVHKRQIDKFVYIKNKKKIIFLTHILKNCYSTHATFLITPD